MLYPEGVGEGETGLPYYLFKLSFQSSQIHTRNGPSDLLSGNNSHIEEQINYFAQCIHKSCMYGTAQTHELLTHNNIILVKKM